MDRDPLRIPDNIVVPHWYDPTDAQAYQGYGLIELMQDRPLLNFHYHNVKDTHVPSTQVMPSEDAYAAFYDEDHGEVWLTACAFVHGYCLDMFAFGVCIRGIPASRKEEALGLLMSSVTGSVTGSDTIKVERHNMVDGELTITPIMQGPVVN